MNYVPWGLNDIESPETEKEKQTSACGTKSTHLHFVKGVDNFETILVSLPVI